MKRLHTLIIIVLVTGLSACQYLLSKHPIAQSWKLTEVKTGKVGDTDADMFYTDILRKRFTESYLRMYKDDNYTFIGDKSSAVNKYEYNKERNTLTLHDFYNGKDLLLHVNEADGKWLKLVVLKVDTSFITSDIDLLFKQDAHFEYGNVDILTREENLWRIKPTKKETAQQIKLRVKQHVDFVQKYFKGVDDFKQGYFETWQLQTALSFYANGIGVENTDDMPKRWEVLFYDEEDALQGLEQLTLAMKSINRYPENTKTYTEGYYKALAEMSEFLSK